MTTKVKRRVWAALGVVVLAGLAFHGPALRMSAQRLLANEPLGRFSYVGLLHWNHGPDGDRSYDAAAQLYREQASRPIHVLVIASRPDRLEQLGIVTPCDAFSRRQLASRGVPSEAVATIQTDGNDDWAVAQSLKRWLAAHPDDSLALMGNAFRTAALRSALNAVLDRDESVRVRIRPLPDRRFNETNWWKSRDGYKAFGWNWLLGCYREWIGSSGSISASANCDHYEAEALRSAPPTLPHTDYVLVLNGDENTRPFAAAALVRSGQADRVLITETKPSPHAQELGLPPTHEINRQAMIHRGVDADRITILPAQATTTYDEARALATFLESHPKARVLVVTNDVHVRRSRWVFDRTLGEFARQITFASAPSDDFSTSRWWRTEAGFLAVGTEWLKQAFYFAYYGYLGQWLAACAALWMIATRIRRREINRHPA
ncbi:MAG: YdcF family protein [Thermoguttaceae bacterium]